MYDKILVGTDGSKTAAKAVDRAAEVARMVGGRLTVLSAGKPDKARSVVDAEASRLADAGTDVDTAVVDDDPVAALVETAREGQYDLLVVGNKGMLGVTRFLKPGAVPNKVSHNLPCTLLIVKTT